MAENNFWENVFYKKEFVDTVIKNGEVFKKYRKVQRFTALPKVIIILALCIIATVIFLAFEHSSRNSVDMPAQEAGYTK